MQSLRLGTKSKLSLLNCYQEGNAPIGFVKWMRRRLPDYEIAFELGIVGQIQFDIETVARKLHEAR